MKLRCPYCKQLFEQEKATSHCPKCGKKMRIPDSLKDPSERGKEGEKHAKSLEERLAEKNPQGSKSAIAWGVASLFAVTFLVILLSGKAFVGCGDAQSRQLALVQDNISAGQKDAAMKETTFLRMAVEQFKIDCGRYPTTMEGLESVMACPAGVAGWKGPYLNVFRPDPWGNRYRYECVDGKVTLFSCGQDGLANTPDDILPRDIRKELLAKDTNSVPAQPAP